MEKALTPITKNICSNNCTNCFNLSRSVFKKLNREALQNLEAAKQIKTFKKNSTIIEIDTPPEGVYCIGSGSVLFQSRSTNGRSHLVRASGEGSIIGSMLYFSGEKSNLEAIAKEDVTACFIPNKTFQTLLEKYIELHYEVTYQCSRDFISLETRLVGMMKGTVKQRIIDTLIQFKNDKNICTLTRKEIAEWTAASNENVIRTLTTLEDEKLISKTRTSITILNLNKLKKFLD